MCCERWGCLVSCTRKPPECNSMERCVMSAAKLRSVWGAACFRLGAGAASSGRSMNKSGLQLTDLTTPIYVQQSNTSLQFDQRTSAYYLSQPLFSQMPAKLNRAIDYFSISQHSNIHHVAVNNYVWLYVWLNA